MAAAAASSILCPPPPPLSSSSSLFSSYITQTAIFIPNTKPPRFTTLVLASSHSSPNHYPDNSHTKKSILSSLVQDIEPLDVSLIQKDVPLVTVDAMKRTISGMLGLLPSDQFQVSIDALWEPLSKLLVSSMMTGYTLRNAEYRLCLERNLEIYEGNFEKQKTEDSKCEAKGTLLNDCGVVNLPKQNDISLEDNGSDIISTIPDFGKITPEALREQTGGRLSEPTSAELKGRFSSSPWCMLFGALSQGLEYRSELTELSLPFSSVDDSSSGQVA
ncbi:hypothetical protein Leryth_004304 [Lithospermum erythrorhizon]|nr:hypothetical protein Leryth_004304 [Lithospermum erythrorhizon]